MSERLAVFFDPCILDHDTGRGFFEASASPYLPIIENHPENAERARNMLAVLQQGGYAISYAAYCLHASLEGVLQRAASLADPLAYMRENIDGLDDFLGELRRRYTTTVKQARKPEKETEAEN